MKGLLIKDLYMAKKHSMILIIIALMFFAISLFGKTIYFSFYPIAMISIVCINSLAYDDYYKWNKYEVVLPVSRVQAVIEKYILLLIFILPSAIISSLAFFLAFHYDFREMISLISIMLFTGVMMPTVVYPLFFKVGYAKAKTLSVVLQGIIISLIVFINMRNISGEMLITGSFAPQKSTPLFAVAAVILLGISMLLSIQFYKKREF